MSLIIGFLTFFLVLDCVFLVFLVLLQLPKKEAGAGVAFGGGATDALFGAGSGNMLTKITTWTAGIFFGLCVVLALLSSRQARNTGASALAEELGNRPKTTAPVPGTGLLQTPTTSSNIVAPAPEATPVKPVPSTGLSGEAAQPSATSKTPAPSPTPSTTSKTAPTPKTKP
jgi:preprotein translocase subunit SecG